MTGGTSASYKATKASVILRELLRDSVRSEHADALLLGGLDSSCLAVLDTRVPAFTVGVKGAGERLDLHFAGITAKHLKLEWHPILLSIEEAKDNLRLVVRTTRTYDVALLNDLALFVAINRAIEYLGTRTITIRSGEPADTLFRGYRGTYFLERNLLNRGIDNSVRDTMPLALLERGIGISAAYPFMDSKVKSLAKTLAMHDNISFRMVPGGIWDTHPDNLHLRLTGPPYPLGKMTLRRAFHGELPTAVLSRRKAEIQFGSGTDILRSSYLPRLVDEDEISEFIKGGLHFRDRAHAGLYKLYKEEGYRPHSPLANETECLWCHGGVARNPDGTEGTHCYTCGGDSSNVLPDEMWLQKLRTA